MSTTLDQSVVEADVIEFGQVDIRLVYFGTGLSSGFEGINDGDDSDGGWAVIDCSETSCPGEEVLVTGSGCYDGGVWGVIDCSGASCLGGEVVLPEPRCDVGDI